MCRNHFIMDIHGIFSCLLLVASEKTNLMCDCHRYSSTLFHLRWLPFVLVSRTAFATTGCPRHPDGRTGRNCEEIWRNSWPNSLRRKHPRTFDLCRAVDKCAEDCCGAVFFEESSAWFRMGYNGYTVTHLTNIAKQMISECLVWK